MIRTYGRLYREGKRWFIECEAHVMIRLKRCFAQVDKGDQGTATIVDNAANARDLEWFCERFPMRASKADAAYLLQRARAHDRAMASVQRVLQRKGEPPTFALALPPRRYQRQAADLALRTGRLLLGDDVGLGKTATAICLLSHQRARPGVVVTLAHLPLQWRAEIAKFAPSLNVMIPKKSEPTDKERARLEGLERPDVVVLNYHKLSGWAQTLREVLAPRAVVFDEVQELRTGRSSDKGRGAEHVAFGCDYRLGLSATPVFNYGGEIWHIYSILAPDELGTWSEFLREWCGDNEFGTNQQHAALSQPRAFGLYLRERGLFLRRLGSDVKDEVPELAKPMRIPHLVEANLKTIERAQTDAAALARLILSSDGTGAEKMRAAGELDWRMRQATGIAKAPYVAAFVRVLLNTEERVVLYGWHRAVYEQWGELLHDIPHVFFTGEESPVQKQASKEAFTKGRARILIMSLRAGAGLEGLQEVARCVVFGELDWSPGVHEQCIGRLHRPGQPEMVRAYFLHTTYGSDPFVMETLGFKRAQSEQLRDPNVEVLGQSGNASAHIRALAEACLKEAEKRTTQRHAEAMA